HILTKKDTKRKRRLRQQTLVSKAQENTVKNCLIPYKG
ncbi:MAG: 50S ribosomal protein L35, partial [Clostridia bacterium]|nr:50S ribosomal protein L35 [Clostridia bacterium]